MADEDELEVRLRKHWRAAGCVAEVRCTRLVTALHLQTSPRTRFGPSYATLSSARGDPAGFRSHRRRPYANSLAHGYTHDGLP